MKKTRHIPWAAYWYWPLCLGTFEAEVLVDGAPLRDASGRPFTTPCTATGIPAGRHRVAFRHPVRGMFDAGSIDFTTVREVVVTW